MVILCEEFDYSKSRGRIVYYEESADDHTFSTKGVAIELPTHLSYPYLLEHEGEAYCIPETAQTREIALYKARDFPRDWEKVATLIKDFPGVDSSIFHFNGRWWLTCAKQDDRPWEKLFVWHAENLTGPWQPHSANPVKVNAHSSQPAGTPFVHEGNLYRPAQDCSERYGADVVVNHVTRLTPDEFHEEETAAIKPFNQYPQGVHTLSSLDGFSLVDGRRMRYIRSLSELRHNLESQSRNFQRRSSGQSIAPTRA